MSADAAAEKRLAMLEQLISRGSTDPFHHYARAAELKSLGRLDAALEAYAAVRDRFPDYLPTFLMAGQVAETLDRIEEARAWLEAGIALAQKQGEAHALSELRAALMDLGS